MTDLRLFPSELDVLVLAIALLMALIVWLSSGDFL